MQRDGRYFRPVFADHSAVRAPKHVRINTVARRQGAEIHDPLIGRPDDSREPPHDRQRNLGMRVQNVDKHPLRDDHDNHGVGGHNFGQRRLIVDCSDLTKGRSGKQIVENDLPAGDGVVENLCSAADEEQNVAAAAVALDEPDGLVVDVTAVAHLFGGERRLVADVEGRFAARGLALEALFTRADLPL